MADPPGATFLQNTDSSSRNTYQLPIVPLLEVGLGADHLSMLKVGQAWFCTGLVHTVTIAEFICRCPTVSVLPWNRSLPLGLMLFPLPLL